MVLDYFQQKVDVWVASRDVERFKTKNPRKLENFKKIPEMLRLDGEIFTFVLGNCEKIRHSIVKPIFLTSWFKVPYKHLGWSTLQQQLQWFLVASLGYHCTNNEVFH